MPVPTNYPKKMSNTFPESFTEPRPRMYTLHSVMASTLFKEFPRGPKIRPTKLYCQVWCEKLLIKTKSLKINSAQIITPSLLTCGYLSTGRSSLITLFTIGVVGIPCPPSHPIEGDWNGAILWMCPLSYRRQIMMNEDSHIQTT